MNLDEITFQEMPKTPSEMPTKEEIEQFDKEMELYDRQQKELEKQLAQEKDVEREWLNH